jgi:uncharacterized metal-binding protein
MPKLYSDWHHRDANDVKSRLNFTFDKGNIVPIIRVESIHALNTLVGYCKHKYKDDGNIFFRGQTQNYGALVPSLYRGLKSESTLNKKKSKLNKLVKSSIDTNSILSKMDKELVYPLLQLMVLKQTGSILSIIFGLRFGSQFMNIFELINLRNMNS